MPKLRITYPTAPLFANEYARNLESNEAFVRTPSPLDEGMMCVFELNVPHAGAPFIFQGTVVWSSVGRTLDDGEAVGMRFSLDLDVETRDRMQVLISKHGG
jgi:hypothetical protein